MNYQLINFREKEPSLPSNLSAKPPESTKNEHISAVTKADKPDKGSGKGTEV